MQVDVAAPSCLDWSSGIRRCVGGRCDVEHDGARCRSGGSSRPSFDDLVVRRFRRRRQRRIGVGWKRSRRKRQRRIGVGWKRSRRKRQRRIVGVGWKRSRRKRQRRNRRRVEAIPQEAATAHRRRVEAVPQEAATAHQHRVERQRASPRVMARATAARHRRRRFSRPRRGTSVWPIREVRELPLRRPAEQLGGGCERELEPGRSVEHERVSTRRRGRRQRLRLTG